MAIMPGAQWRPLPRPSSTRMDRYDLTVIHTCVGSFEGTDAYFRRLTNGTNSHFLTGGYGEIRQLVDTAVRSGANGAGNHRSITVENADMGPGFAPWDTRSAANVPAFTPQQVEANAQICAWAHIRHGVPLVAADTSRPSARGVGYHRLGCDPYRVPDGERWSSSYGKVCPGSRRIAQIPQIIARAQQIVNGDDDMQLDELLNFRVEGRNLWDFLRDIHQETTGRLPSRLPGDEGSDTMLGYSASAHAEAAMARRVATELRDLLRNSPLPAPPDGISPALPSIDYDRLAEAIVAVQNRQARDGDPATGPAT